MHLPESHPTVKALRACRRCEDTSENVMAAYRREREATIQQAQRRATRELRTLLVYWDNVRACFAIGTSAPWHATSQTTIHP